VKETRIQEVKIELVLDTVKKYKCRQNAKEKACKNKTHG
jgi:hypothetical protein